MEALSPVKYDCYVEYFKEFYEFNKQKYPNFSYQYFSNKAQWPNSLLGDIINERRGLTVGRAVQFISALNMDHLDSEHLIYLIFKGSNNPQVKSFFSEAIQKKFNFDHYRELEVKDLAFKDIDYLGVFELLLWAKEKLSPEKVCQLLGLSSSITPEKVTLIYSKLEEVGAVKFHPDNSIEALVDSVFYSTSGEEDKLEWLFLQFSKNNRAYSKKWYTPHVLNTFYLELPMDRMEEILDKMIMMRNWLMELSFEMREKKKTEKKEGLVFQADMNLFPIMDKKLTDGL